MSISESRFNWSGPIAWPTVRDWFDKKYPSDSAGHHIVDIIDDVVGSGHGEELIATVAMGDLYVAAAPVSDPPLELIVVWGPLGARNISSEKVRIEHLTTTNRNDVIERHSDEAVPLFWSFVQTKFGIVR